MWAYHGVMKIIGILETIETGAVEEIESECVDYRHGFEALRRLLPEGIRLLSVRVEP